MLALAALGGCSLTPRYVRPEPAIPPGWPKGDAYLAASEAPLPSVRHTEIFRDARLQRVITAALARNQDLALALANVEAARALWRVQRAQLFPQVDAGAGVTVQRRTADAAGTDRTDASYRVDAGITAFELDLFGRLRALSSAAFQTYLGQAAAARAARLTVVADVAAAWLTLAADRSLLAIAIDTERSAQASYDLTRARLTGGVAPRSDVRQAETILAQARADRAALTTQVAQDLNAIQLLAGGPIDGADLPNAIEAVEGGIVPLPAGVDSLVLLRRPDVVQAEYRLRAANARIGAVRAAFFPTIGLTAIAGFASTALSSLFTGGAFNWSVQPGASLPIFDGGANRGNLANARAERDAALAQYQRAIQVAFREVADALARRGTIERELAAQNQLAAAAADTLALQDARYRQGIDPYLNTLDAQRTLYAARRSLVETRLTRVVNLVDLYRTLGGDALLDPPRDGEGDRLP